LVEEKLGKKSEKNVEVKGQDATKYTMVETQKEGEKLNLKGEKVVVAQTTVSSKAKVDQPKSAKPKVLELGEFVGEQSDKKYQQQSRQYPNTNRKVNNNQFPSLVEDPNSSKQNNPRNNYQGKGGYKGKNNSADNNNSTQQNQ